MAIKLLIAGLCVLANAFFVAAEFGLVKVRTTQLMIRARDGEWRAAGTMEIIKRLDAYLSACQLGITAASLGLGWVGEPAVAALLNPAILALGASESVMHGVSFTIAFAFITTIHIVIGEQAPKMLAIQKAESIALAVSAPMRLFFLIAYPALWCLNGLSNLTLRLFGLAGKISPEDRLSADEIRLILLSGEIDPQKRQLIERVMMGTDRPVRSIMVPRVDMATLSLDDSAERVTSIARASGYSRLPVIESHDPDRVVGYVYVKDLVMSEGLPPGGVAALRRDILFVPENRKLGDVLGDFQRSHIPIAIVVDEYGGTSGLVTVEDILEEIVGEIQDELDSETARIVQREDGSLVVDGIVALADLEPMGIPVEADQGPVHIAGYILARLGRLARPGDSVPIGPYDATVEDVRGRRLTRVRLTRRPEPAAADQIQPPDRESFPDRSNEWDREPPE